MREEFDTLIRNETWELAPRFPNDHVVNNIWLFKVKEKSDSIVEQPKAILVENRMNLEQGYDYNEAFSSAVKAIAIWVVLPIDVSRGWKMKQINTSNAFLYGQLEERIFMRQPINFLDEEHHAHVFYWKN